MAPTAEPRGFVFAGLHELFFEPPDRESTDHPWYSGRRNRAYHHSGGAEHGTGVRKLPIVSGHRRIGGPHSDHGRDRLRAIQHSAKRCSPVHHRSQTGADCGDSRNHRQSTLRDGDRTYKRTLRSAAFPGLQYHLNRDQRSFQRSSCAVNLAFKTPERVVGSQDGSADRKVATSSRSPDKLALQASGLQ